MITKTKLRLGLGILLVLIIFLTYFSAFNLGKLNRDSKNILSDNYNSLEYCREMIAELEKIENTNWHLFNENLQKQQQNITEKNENILTENLIKHSKFLNQNINNDSIRILIRKDLYTIMTLNLNAIKSKSQLAEKTAQNISIYLVIVGAISTFIGGILLISLPKNIGDPIKIIKDSFKEIANKNYIHRLDFDNKSEFFELSKSFNTMADKLQQYETSTYGKLNMEKKRLETLINKMHDPVIGIDEFKKIIFANEEAKKIIGLQEIDFVGKQINEVAEKNDLVRNLMVKFENTNKKTEPFKIYADEKESYFDLEIVPITIEETNSEKHQSIGSVIILRNITDYKELDFAKTNFIATVSHEFKTPISSMKMSLQLLEKETIGTLNVEQKNLIESIKEDTNRLLRTTVELLNITQVETGKSKLNIKKTNPKDCVSDAMKSTEKLALEKNISLDFRFDNNEIEIEIDPEKTTWIVSNLLSNAIRYSYENSTVYVSLREKPNQIEIIVKDKGKGIDKQYQSKIFDRYFRVPGSKYDGTGLGLAISKEFIEALGGTITFESELGNGSEFKIVFKK